MSNAKENRPLPRKENRHAPRQAIPERRHGVIARLAYGHAQAAGIALDPLLEQSGLSRRQMESPGALIKVRDQIGFLNLVANALDDDLLGFHLAQTPDLRMFSLLYYIPASSETC